MQAIKCGRGLIKENVQYYYTDCCGNFISGFNDTGDYLEISYNYDVTNGGVVDLNVTASTSCATPTPTPTQTVTPTNTTTPTQTPTNTQTPTPSITPSITPSNSPVTRLQNSCDVVTIFDMGISCNVIQNPSSPTSLDGIISVNVTGGTAPYSFFWAGGQRTQTLFGVPQGTYEVVVTDYKWPDGNENGVSDFTASTICSLIGPSPTQTPTMTPTPSSTPPVQCESLCLIATNPNEVLYGPSLFECNGIKNDKITWTNGRIEIVWNPINNRWEIYGNDGGEPFMLNGSILASTDPSAIPTSAWQFYGGTANGTITVTTGSCPEYPPLSLNLLTTNNTCQGMKTCDGSITANVQGGLAPYYYSINDGVTTQTSPTFTNLCPNTYIVNVYDSLGNQQSGTVEIGFNSSPVTYNLSLVNDGPPTTITVPNDVQTITQNLKLVVTPALPVGLTINFDLISTALETQNQPGTVSMTTNWSVNKNGATLPTILGPTTSVSSNTRPGCSPNLQIVNTRSYTNNSISITSSDVINVVSTTVIDITNGQGSAQSNCTTSGIDEVSAVITNVGIIGNDCVSAIGSSRQIQRNEFTYIPPVEPPVLVCFGYLYNFYAITGSTTQSLTSSDSWSVPTQSDFQTLVNSVSNNARALRLVNTTTYWNNLNNNATNTSGFSAKGSGFRDTNDNLGFGNLRQSVIYHSKTTWNLDPTKTISLSMDSGSITPLISALTHNNKTGGSSVRLVRNTTPLLPGQTGTYIGNDGKSYNTICIGTQEWMSEDLRETEYRNSSPIPNVTSQSVWSGLTTGAYCIYNNDSTNVAGCSENLP